MVFSEDWRESVEHEFDNVDECLHAWHEDHLFASVIERYANRDVAVQLDLVVYVRRDGVNVHR